MSRRSIENFKPRLRQGRITPQGRRMVYETDDGDRQIVLPAEMADLILLATGKFTVREIIEKIFKRKGSVHFRTLFNTIHQLRDHGFFENGDSLESYSWWSSSKSGRRRWYKDIPLLRRIAWHSPLPMGFYVLGMALISLTLCSLSMTTWPPLTPNTYMAFDSAWKTFAITMALISLFQSLQALTQVSFQLLLTGNMFGLYLRLTPWGIYLKATDEPIFLITNRLFLTLYHGTIIAIPLLAIWPLMPYHELYTLAWAVASCKLVWDLSPFTASKFTQTARSLLSLAQSDLVAGYLPENSLLALLGPPGSPHRSRRLRHYFIFYTLLWSVVALWLCSRGLEVAGIIINLDPKTAMGTWLTFSSYGCWIIYRLGLHLYPSISKSFVTARAWLKGRLESLRPVTWDQESLVEELLKLPLFSYFSTALLEVMLQKSEIIQVRGGSRLITQGELGRDLFVLLNGSLSVERTSFNEGRMRLSTLRPVSIFGEMAMVEESVRTADVIARESATVLKVPTKYLKQAALDSQYMREISAFQNAILVNQFFTSAPMFKDLPDDLAHDISMRSSLRTFHKDEVILRQGDFGRSFFMVLRGAVQVRIEDQTVKRIRQGGFFGEISLIADVPRTASIVANEPTIVMEMAASNFWEILCQNIELAMFIETVGESRLSEDLLNAVSSSTEQAS